MGTLNGNGLRAYNLRLKEVYSAVVSAIIKFLKACSKICFCENKTLF